MTTDDAVASYTTLTGAAVNEYAPGISANSNCFGYSPSSDRNGTFNHLTWDESGRHWYGSYPRDWDGSGGNILTEFNWSGAMKARQAGVFGNGCEWATWSWGIGGSVYQDKGSNTGNDRVKVTYTHSWSTSGWSWSFSCGAGPEGPECGFSATPVTGTDYWTLNGTSSIYNPATTPPP